MQLTAHFNLAELTQSQTAARRGLANTPPPAAVDALRALCANVLEPLRAQLGRPIVVSSGYRSPEVNKAVGGSATSQHCRGEAVDFTVPGLTPQQVFDAIRASDLEFDQLILEFGRWVHLSHAHARKQRGECLVAHQTAQGVKYVQASRRPANPPTLPKQTAQPGQALRPLPPTAYAPGATPLSAPNDEFSTIQQPVSIAWDSPAHAPEQSANVQPRATVAQSMALQNTWSELKDRLFGSGAGDTGFAVSLLALAGWWNELAVILQSAGITLPQSRGAWAALAVAVVKFLISKGRKKGK